MRAMRKIQWLILGLSASAGAVLFVNCADTTKPRIVPPQGTAVATSPAAEDTVDVESAPVPAIPPGTIIASGAPKDFSHLILKSQPRVGADSIEKIMASLADMASMLFTAIVADCRAEKRDGTTAYTLASVAAGVGTKVKGDDMILSSDSCSKLGVDLGMIGSTVLGGGEKQLRQMRCVARSRTMAILDAPSIMLIDGKHQQVVIRYAILVDPKTGRLDTLVWPMKKTDDAWATIGAAELLSADKMDDCQLHVDTGEFMLGMPTANAFAVRGVPKGKQTVEFSGELKTLAATSPWTVAAATRFEIALEMLLAKPAAPR